MTEARPDLGEVSIEAGREFAGQPALEKLSVLGLLTGNSEQNPVTVHFDVTVDAQPCEVGDSQRPSGEDRDEKGVSICAEVLDFAVA
jgi:hypothetical protein